MKKYIVVVLIFMLLTLSSCTEKCTEDTCTTLPSLTGYNRDEIEDELINLGINFSFRYIEEDLTKDHEFSSYVGYNSGDKIFNDEKLIVEIYPDIIDYFEIIDFDYDGPYLDESFSAINYLNPRGGYFEVTLKYCTDGDTGVFYYPDDVYNAIESSAKSVRFLNMDTEETYSGGEEEWGKPASVYTCDLLNEAESIIIQTDPGDSLLGTYGRLLGWVWIKLPNEEEYFLLNYMVVKQGLAQVKYEFGAGETISYGSHTYNEWMHIAEDYAFENDLGQWGDSLDYYWDYENDKPYRSRW